MYMYNVNCGDLHVGSLRHLQVLYSRWRCTGMDPFPVGVKSEHQLEQYMLLCFHVHIYMYVFT